MFRLFRVLMIVVVTLGVTGFYGFGATFHCTSTDGQEGDVNYEVATRSFARPEILLVMFETC